MTSENWIILSELVAKYYFDVSAILTGLLMLFVIRRKRHETDGTDISRDEAFDIVFAGVKMFFLIVLAIGAFVPKLLTSLLEQHRILLFLTLLYSVWVEYDRLKNFYNQKRRKTDLP